MIIVPFPFLQFSGMLQIYWLYKFTVTSCIIYVTLLHILDTILVHCILHILGTILVHCLI